MATDVRKLAQDAAYVTVGVGVLVFQRAQVARREARVRLESQINTVRSTIEPVAQQVLAHLPFAVGPLGDKSAEERESVNN